jgi:S-adenosylmethionine synthetase
MFRTFSMEAAWGKNPVYHVGKVLGVVADGLSKELAARTGSNNEVLLVAKNGRPLMDPSQVIVRQDLDGRAQEVENVLADILGRTDWTDRIVREELLMPRTGNIVLAGRPTLNLTGLLDRRPSPTDPKYTS